MIVVWVQQWCRVSTVGVWINWIRASTHKSAHSSLHISGRITKIKANPAAFTTKDCFYRAVADARLCDPVQSCCVPVSGVPSQHQQTFLATKYARNGRNVRVAPYEADTVVMHETWPPIHLSLGLDLLCLGGKGPYMPGRELSRDRFWKHTLTTDSNINSNTLNQSSITSITFHLRLTKMNTSAIPLWSLGWEAWSLLFK